MTMIRSGSLHGILKHRQDLQIILLMATRYGISNSCNRLTDEFISPNYNQPYPLAVAPAAPRPSSLSNRSNAAPSTSTFSLSSILVHDTLSTNPITMYQPTTSANTPNLMDLVPTWPNTPNPTSL